MIFYFSATGNSKYLAKKISEKCKEKLVDITDAMLFETFSFELSDTERLGFVMPVYFYGVPSVVLEFLEKLSIKTKGKNYTFAAFTCGGTTADAGGMLEKALLKKGIRIDAFFAEAMPDNYILMYDIADEKGAREKLQRAEKGICEISEKIVLKEKGDFNNLKGAKFMTKVLYPLYKPFRSTKRFYADENCIGCKKCEKECVERAIKIQNGRPVWVKKECSSCLHCIHACPKAAIQFGKSTKNRNRYMNPNA